MYPAYEPTSVAHTVLAFVFYIVMVGFLIYSALAVYALLKFGKSKTLALGVSIFYGVIVTTLFAVAVANLNNIEF